MAASSKDRLLGDNEFATSARSKILDSARNLFAQNGFEGVSTREIAKRVGIQQATLYHYFKNKDEIYQQVVELAYEFVADQLVASLSIDGTAEERLRSFFFTSILVFHSNVPEVHIVDYDLPGNRGDEPKFAGTSARRIHEALSAIIREIDVEGPAEKYAFFFFSLAHGARKQHPMQLHLTGLDDLRDLKSLSEALVTWGLKAIENNRRVPQIAQDRIEHLEQENNRLRELFVDLSLKYGGMEPKYMTDAKSLAPDIAQESGGE